MKLNALQALVAAIEEGSFRGAARRLGVSQPALTKTLRELELELSTTLVERSTRGVSPTLQGKVLYERALNVQRELAAATDAINQMGGNMVGTLSVGAVPLAVMLLVPEAARTFGRDFPGVKLLPSEYFRRQVYACCWFESIPDDAMLEFVGKDNIMFETDFPHPTSLYPIDNLEERLSSLTAEDRAKVLSLNAAKLYGIAI